ncbi:MAG: hypothetical protein AAGF31_06515 [Planctomycetota bacterium]
MLPTMRQRSTTPLRRDLALANINAAIWAFGNGLVSTTLVIYLALELGAAGFAISGILAAPRFAGVLRLGLPSFLARLPHRKALCAAFFLASGGVLLGMAPAATGVAAGGIAMLVLAWCVHHLLQYCGVVLLWSWLGDLMPLPVRGRLIGRRERWLTIGRVAGLGVSFSLATAWPWLSPESAETKWLPLAYSASIGAVLLMASALPLLGIRSRESQPSATPHATWKAIAHCFFDPAYRRLMTFSCCFAVANGMTAAAQNLYPKRVLGIDYEVIIALRAMMRGGQAAVAPAAGRWIDRSGAKRMMFGCQLIVASGPLFYWLASAEAPWWFVGAWVAWIAYAGLNVGLDHLKVTLAPPKNNVPAIAAYHAVADLVNGLVVLAGGLVFDRLVAGGTEVLPLYGTLFLAGWVARTAVAGLLLRLIEPARRNSEADNVR